MKGKTQKPAVATKELWKCKKKRLFGRLKPHKVCAAAFSDVACHDPHVASGLQFLCISAHVYSADMLILERAQYMVGPHVILWTCFCKDEVFF